MGEKHSLKYVKTQDDDDNSDGENFMLNSFQEFVSGARPGISQ